MNDISATFQRNLISYLREKGSTQSDLAVYLDVNKATVSDWVSGRKFPRHNAIDGICDYFGIEPMYLFADSFKELPELTVNEQKLIGLYRNLSKSDQRKIYSYINDIFELAKYKEEKSE